jgi:NAD(P)-dependent dehydrogenase (short-subunit alcohol dehydrogenase family)
VNVPTPRGAVVTGASGGIGSEVARLLGDGGWRLLLVDESADGLARVRKSLADGTGNADVATVVGDVADPALPGRVADAVTAAGWSLGGVVNAAGVTSRIPLDRLTDAEWDRVFAVNVTAAFRLVRALVPHLRRSGHASIVNVSSVAGLNAPPGMPAYSSSKAALLGLTRSLARDLLASGVRVNAVCPASIDTPMAREPTIGLSAEQAALYESRHFSRQLMDRYGTPEEVGRVIAFLLSDQASFMTGLSLPVDGGYTAW